MKAKRLTLFDIFGLIFCMALLAFFIGTFWLCHTHFSRQLQHENLPPTAARLSEPP